jgi:hypothetical protein
MVPQVLSGLVAGGHLRTRIVPNVWQSLLVGAQWSPGWGLYVPLPTEPVTLAAEFGVETRTHPQTDAVLAASFRVAGVPFTQVLGQPDVRSAWGIQRPRCLRFQNGAYDIRLSFSWPGRAGGSVDFKKVGVSSNRPPQWANWRE